MYMTYDITFMANRGKILLEESEIEPYAKGYILENIELIAEIRVK